MSDKRLRGILLAQTIEGDKTRRSFRHSTRMQLFATVIAIILFAVFLKSAIGGASAKAPKPLTFVYAINGTSADKYDVNTIFVDLFDATTDRVKKLKAQGKSVICYFSSGSLEKNRPDTSSIPKSAIGLAMKGWPENWLDYRNPSVQKVMAGRIQKAQSLGCNGVDPDNIDGHLNKTGFPLTAKDQLAYMSYLSKEAKARGLKIGLKNSSETIKQLAPLVDFVVIEECFKYNECQKYDPVKIRYLIEYTPMSLDQCKKVATMNASIIFANKDLTKFEFCK